MPSFPESTMRGASWRSVSEATQSLFCQPCAADRCCGWMYPTACCECCIAKSSYCCAAGGVLYCRFSGTCVFLRRFVVSFELLLCGELSNDTVVNQSVRGEGCYTRTLRSVEAAIALVGAHNERVRRARCLLLVVCCAARKLRVHMIHVHTPRYDNV